MGTLLVTGPTRSGKSEWAETLAHQHPKTVLYLATAQSNPEDPDWQARIQAHQRRRPTHWTTIQEPFAIAPLIATAPADHCILLDSLGTWLANRLEEPDPTWHHTQQEFLQSCQITQALVIVVAEETGWGIVPSYASGRLFRDRLGQLTRLLAQDAIATYLVCAGFAVNLKEIGVFVAPNPSNL
jgi:adenosylcobinamide kinase/adenosylcobinamide-phosphate guanylyltransferase